ncbi:LLM class flavin-dependent oxidoreductase [Nakamurella leprariae]|uniref:LLM class flavin-dependent oxidoreductase n=1 Tax=Nakamurella leprariae TaxID=2803911 RepID=A0A938Y6J2_9ACTN|nr:LLM class flavin-dependent oxidoreductase [Nakamurella leprariae]MBM9466710.1 LLM class flavin-dependent oxidoreductase [Nakamurella leprariae]
MSLVVGIEIEGDGGHPAAWRAADHPPDTLLSARRIGTLVGELEEAGVGFLTIADATPSGAGGAVPARLDPVVLASLLSASTTAIGLVPQVHTAHGEPFHIANQLSSLDHGSRGRAGWWVGTEASADRARAAGQPWPAHPAVLAAEASDVVDAARRLWDSWEDDAIIADEISGRFLDADKVHHIDFRGDQFSIRGPGLMPRPIQGGVPVFADAGHLRPGLADVVVVRGPSVSAVAAAAGAARAAGAPRVVTEVEVVLDAGGGAANDRLAALDANTPWPRGERVRLVGHPDPVAVGLRELAGSVDGVRVIPAVLDVDLPVLTAAVLPALGDLVRVPRPGGRLRDLFGLPRPASRYAHLAIERESVRGV